MSYLSNLVTRRNTIATELAALTSSLAGGKPNAGKAGIDHVGYKDGLYRELEFLNSEIDRLGGDGTDGGTTTFEIESVVE